MDTYSGIFNTRSERKDLSKPGANDSVGPGTYEHELSGFSVAAESTVPFQSLSDRSNFGRSNLVVPGPGTYAVRRETASPGPDVRFIATSASAFRSRAPKISPAIGCPGSTEFVAATSKYNPGPGEYVVERDLVKPLQVKKDPRHGLSSISYSKTMPSMPQPHDPTEMRFSGREGDKLGPGDYDGSIPNQLRRSFTTTNFHKSNSKRDFFSHNNSVDNFMPHPDSPGPGGYRTATHLNKGTTAGFRSKVQQVPPMLIQDGPGPGWYEDLGSFEVEDKPLAFASIRSGSERSLFPCGEEVPGPGTYPKKDGFSGSKIKRARSTADVLDGHKFHAVHQPHQMMSLRDSQGQKMWGFDSSSERHCNKPLKDNGGASFYNIDESIGCSMKSKLKESAKSGRKGAFGSGSERKFVLGGANDSLESPGPGDAQNIEAKPFDSTKGEHSVASFKSTQQRIPRKRIENRSEGPDPGAYEVFDKVEYRNKFRQPKTDHLSFGSSASRWNPHDVVGGQKHLYHPGPGEYDTSITVGHVVGGLISTAQKGAGDPKHQGLGPGMYDVHGTTMHRMTYNVSSHEAAKKGLGFNQMEPPNIGGGAGGGIHGTRSRLGHLPGGSGFTTNKVDKSIWEMDRVLQQKRARAVAQASKKGWTAIEDGAVVSTSAAAPASPIQATLASPAQQSVAPAATTAGWSPTSSSPAAAPVAEALAVASPAVEVTKDSVLPAAEAGGAV